MSLRAIAQVLSWVKNFSLIIKYIGCKIILFVFKKKYFNLLYLINIMVIVCSGMLNLFKCLITLGCITQQYSNRIILQRIVIASLFFIPESSSCFIFASFTLYIKNYK